jgi:hypothetical protein
MELRRDARSGSMALPVSTAVGESGIGEGVFEPVLRVKTVVTGG